MGWADKHIDKPKKKFLEPNDEHLPQGRIHPFYMEPSSERAMSIGGEEGEPAYLIPSFKYGHPLDNPLKEYRETGEHLGGPFKTWQEADEWERTIRHPYVEKNQALPSPLKRWGKDFRSGGEIMNVASPKYPIAQAGKNIKFRDSSGNEKYISIDEYRDLYNSEKIATTYDDKTFSMKDLPEVEIKGEKSGFQRWVDNYTNTINKETTDPIGMLMAPMNAMMSIPQLAAVSLFTGKPERPSTALGIENPLGAIATDMMLDPLNLIGAKFKSPLSGVGKLIEERGIGAINPFYYKENPEMMYKSLNKSQVKKMIERGEIYKNINANSYGKYLPIYNSDGSVEYVYRTFTKPKKEIAKPKIGFIKEDGKFKKIELEKDLSKHDPTTTFILDRTKKAGDKGRFITLNNYLNRIRAKESGTKKIGTSPYVQFTKGAIEKAYAPSLQTSRIPADYILEVDPSEVGFIKTTKRGQIDPTFEPLTTVGERGMPASVLDDEYLSIDSPGVRLMKKDRWHGYREIEKGNLSLREKSLDVAQDVLNKNADVLDKKIRQVGKNVKKVLPDIPGLTVDDPERGLHALTSDHWVLHPNSSESQKILYAEAALNRLLPIIKHTPLINPIKRVAKQIMSQGAGPTRDKESIINGIKLALFNKNAPMGSYTGQFTPNQSDRNLLDLYLYGNETGFTKANPDILKIDIGERYKKLYPNAEYYLMNSELPHNEPISSDYLYGFKENIPQSSSDMGSPVNSFDNIAGHMVELKNQNDKRILVTQDLWKFNPLDYGKKWAHREIDRKQAAILNQLGKPFYLIQNNPVYKNGGFLGTTNKGRDYSPAWGGQFQNGGEIRKLYIGGETEDKKNYEYKRKLNDKLSFEKEGYMYNPIIHFSESKGFYHTGKYKKRKIIPKKEYQQMKEAMWDSLDASNYTGEVYSALEDSFTPEMFENKEKELRKQFIEDKSFPIKPTGYQDYRFNQNKLYHIPLYEPPSFDPDDYYTPKVSTWEKINEWGDDKLDFLNDAAHALKLNHVEQWVRRKYDDWFGTHDKNYEGVNSDTIQQKREEIKRIQDSIDMMRHPEKYQIAQEIEKLKKKSPSQRQQTTLLPIYDVPPVDISPIENIQRIPLMQSKEINTTESSIPQRTMKKVRAGWEQVDPNYKMLKIRYDKNGRPTHFVNSAGETLYYDNSSANPYSGITREFAYPKKLQGGGSVAPYFPKERNYFAPTQEEKILDAASRIKQTQEAHPTQEEVDQLVASMPAPGTADYVPLEALALPGTPVIKGIGKVANFAVDALNPLAGMAKSKLSNIPGITADAPELGFHALNREHWALHPSFLDVPNREKALLYTEAALNRALPVLKKVGAHKPIKKIAEKVMRQQSGSYRNTNDVKDAIRNLFSSKGENYTGSYNFIDDFDDPPSKRDLINLYLYGNENGFERAGEDVLKIDLGERYNKLYPNSKYYMMQSEVPHGDYLHPAYYTGKEPNKVFNYIQDENPINPYDNVSGHLAKIVETPKGRVAISQDLWKFNPADYSKRWGERMSEIEAERFIDDEDYIRNAKFDILTAEKQSGILDKLGKPFYLVQNNPIHRTGGKVKQDNLGYYNPENWGKPVRINSPNITMEGIDFPILGVSDEGDTKLLKPGRNYKFKGKSVTEYPIAKYGINEVKELTDFSNRPPKKRIGGWASKHITN